MQLHNTPCLIKSLVLTLLVKTTRLSSTIRLLSMFSESSTSRIIKPPPMLSSESFTSNTFPYPTNLSQYSQNFPPVMLPQPTPKPSSLSVPPTTIGKLQLQLKETQSSLANYTNKFHLLNSLVTDHGGLKWGIELIKEFMEECKLRNNIMAMNSQMMTLMPTVFLPSSPQAREGR